jgi:DNA-binding LytR/AlgR family response regulator
MPRFRMFRPDTSWVSFLAAAAAGLVVLFVLLDPHPSRGLPTWGRAVFWAWHVCLPIMLSQAVQVALSRHPPPGLSNPWAAVAAAGALGSALFVPLALAYDRFGPAPPDQDAADGISPAAIAEEWASLAPAVTLVWIGLNAARFLRLASPVSAEPAPAGPPTGDRVPSFLDRVPPDRRGPLVALSAELHYLRVHTTRGEALVLCNFGDALAELGPDLGVQVHRSHWVARRYVAGVRRDGARLWVTTTTGLSLPVSRSRRSIADQWPAHGPPGTLT